MYPTLELVECPKCGSPHKQPLGAELYKCADCGMHYHLDWVGAGVQVRQPMAPLPSPTAQQNWLPLKVLLVVVVAIALLVGVSFWAAAGARA